MTTQSAVSGSSALSASQSSSSANLVGWNTLTALEALRRGLIRLRNVLSLAAAVVLLNAIGFTAQAQITLAPSWSQLSPANSPPERYILGTTYDSGHSQIVLFGGFGDNGDLNDTWLWNGTTWTQANPTNSPSPRAAVEMAYDAAHSQVVLFGGLTGSSGRSADTWLWDGTNWTQANPVNSPPARASASMAYFPGRGVLLFGGVNAGGEEINDTWLWDGTNWNQLGPANSPSARADYGMAYDAALGEIVMFGGESATGAYLSDTWVWTGTNWNQMYPATIPPGRYTPGMDYDASQGQLVMFSGYNGSFLADTWLFNGTNWTQSTGTTSPSARYAQNGMTYDAATSQMILFGGLNTTQLSDTWTFGMPGNFGNVDVCPAGATTPAPCTSTIAFTYNVASATTFGATQIVTQGASGLDFTLASSTCTGAISAGSSCTVNVNFAPLAPGQRLGAIDLPNSGAQLVTTLLSGAGQGPAAAVAPGSSAAVVSGLTSPYATAVDAAGNLYVTDTGTSHVLKVALNGTTTQLGVTFATPAGVAVDGAGDVFVADEGTSAIVEIPSGCITGNPCQNTLAASQGVTKQSGVAVDGTGNVFFTSLAPAQLTEIPAGCTSTSCTKVVWTGPIGQGASQPDGVAVDAAGDIFIADGGGPHNVTKIPVGCASAACQVTVGTQFEAPTGVAVDAAGDVFVSDANLGVFEVPAGCTTYSCQSYVSSGGAPFGLAVDAAGDIYVPDLTGTQVLKVNRSQSEALNFPTTTLGTTNTASVTLQNIGNQSLLPESPGLITIAGASYSNTAGPGTLPDCSATSSLTLGGQCNQTVLFSPQSYTQPNTGTATFATNSLNATSASQTVTLFGMGAKPVQSFYPVIVSEPGSGSGLVTDGSNAISCTETNGTTSGSCAASLPGGGVVTFTATPSGSATFHGWAGACASSGTNSSCSIVLTQATSITANFFNPVYSLSVSGSGTGTGALTDSLGQISCNKSSAGTEIPCIGTYSSGTMVTLTASPSNSSVFAGWGGACSSSGTNPSCVVTVNSSLIVNASFVAPPAALAGTLKPITAGVVYGQGGSFTSNTSNNGGVTASSLGNAQGMFVDGSGNLYLSDGANNRVLFFPAGSTAPTRVYGQSGSFTSSAANNGGISANSLFNPQGIAVDGSGDVYISDEDNSRVLFYPAGSTTATRVYGQSGSLTAGAQNNGGVSANSLSDPVEIALDSSGNLYVADYGNSRVMFYPAGSTSATQVYGQGGSFTSNIVNNGGISANSLNQAQAVALDASDDLYVADIYNNRVLFYPANSTTATQVYGQGGSFITGTINNGGVSASSLNNPLALTVDGNGGLYVVDRSNNRVLFYPFGSTIANRVYGQSGSFTSNAQNNGGVSANSFSGPWSVALDTSGNVYVADYGNSRVLEYGSFGNVNACPANQGTPAPCNSIITMSYAPVSTTKIGATLVLTQGVTGLDFTLGTSNTCSGTVAAGSSCNVNVNFKPLAPGLRSGAVELFDNAGNSLATTPIYGVGQGPVIAYAPGTQGVLLNNLSTYAAGVAVDAAGNVYVAGGLGAVKLTTSGTLTQYPVTGLGAAGFYDVAVDGAGNVYLADSSNNRIVEIAPNGVQTVVPATGLSFPSGVKVDGSGNIFITDRDNNRVVKISPAGVQTTVPTIGLIGPYYPAVDAAGDVFFLDSGSQRVLKVTPGGVQSTVPFTGLQAANGLAVDAAGDVFVSDQILNQIFEITPGGVQTRIATGGLSVPAGLAVDAAGNLFIAVNGLNQVVVVVRSLTPSLSFAQTNVGSTSLDSPQTINLQNVGNQTLAGTPALNLGANFTQSSTANCPTTLTLAPSAVCGQTFSFTPQSATFLSGSVVYTDNNLNGSPAVQTISLSGTGAVGGVAGTVAVPNVVGQAQTAVSAPIAAVGLAMGTVSSASSSTVSSGSVISQNPVAGTQVAVGSTVNLLVSSGISKPPTANPLSLENNYFVTGDFVSAGVTLRGTGHGGFATGNITIPSYAQNAANGVPDGSDVVEALLYWQTLESTPAASSTVANFNGYSIVGQQIGNDLPNYVDGTFTGTMRSYRAEVNAYLPVGANGIRIVSGTYAVSLPDGGSALPLTQGASLVMIYRVLSPNFPLKSVIIYDGSAAPAVTGAQIVQGFYDAVGGANGTGKSTSLFASAGTWNTSINSVTLGQSNQYSAPLNPASAYAAVILSTPVNNSDNDGILDAWKAGPGGSDFHAGQPGYYDAKTGTWVGLPGARHGQKDLFVQLDYMCGAVLSSGACDPTQENLFPSPDANGNDPLAMVQQSFANAGVQLHLQVGNAVAESTCVDGSSPQLCQFPNQPGVIDWKNDLEFSKLYPRNVSACLGGGDCTTRFPYGQKDSYHYVLMGHSLAIPAWNTRYGTLSSITVVNGLTTIVTADRGTGINACPSRITLAGVLGNPALNGIYNTTGCANAKTISLATPGVPNWNYPNSTLPEPVIGLTSGTITSISGYSDLGGTDSAVTLGLWLTAPNQDMSKKANVLAGTIFHEIGHTLGLSHGGLYYDGTTPGSYIPTFEGNCKPNYQSVMNYLFQLDGVGPNNAVAFSNQSLTAINENAAGSVTQLTDASNNPATFPTSAWYVPYTLGATVSPATLHCDGSPLIGDSAYRVDAPIAPITPAWSSPQDLSFTGVLQASERGFNDLTNMDLRQIGATGGEFASLASVFSFGSSVTPLNISAGGTVALGSGGTVALGSGGTVALGSGGTVTLSSAGTITMPSGGTIALGSGGNVTIGSSGGTVALGSGGTIALGSGGTVTLSAGGTIALGSGGTVTIPPSGSGGTIALGSGGTIALGSGGTVTIPASGGTYPLNSSGGTIALGSGGTVALGSGGVVTLSGAGTIALGSGGTVALGSGGTIALGSGGTIALGSGGTIALGSGGTIALGSGGTVALGSGGTIALGSGGTVALGSGGTVALGSGGTVTLGGGGNVALGSGGTVALGSGGSATVGAGGSVTLAAGGTVALGSGGTIALGSGGTIALGSGGTVALGSGGTVTLAGGGTIALGSGGTVIVAAGGSYTLNSSGGTIALGSGGTVALGSGGTVTLSGAGTIALGSGGTIALGSGGTVTLINGGTVNLGPGGSVIQATGSAESVGAVSDITPASAGPVANNELTYEVANSVVRPPTAPTETSTPSGVRITWKAPLFGVVQTYTIYRSSNGAPAIVIGSVSGVNGNPPATEFTDTNPDLTSLTVIYTVTTTLVPDTQGPSRNSQPSVPAVLKNDQSITLGPLPSSVTIANPPTITATAMSGGVPNGLQVAFSATGSCSIAGQSIASNVSSASVTLTTTGSCTVSASQPGTTKFNAANSVSGTFLVLPAGSGTQSQTITFAPLPSAQYGGTFALSASSNSGLAVSFKTSGPCTTSGGITGVGLCTITASAPGSSMYSAASLTQSFNIYPAVLKVTASNLAVTYGQSIPSLTYGYSGFVNGDEASVVIGVPGLLTTATATSNAGVYPITVSTGTLATTNYSFLYVSGAVTIQQANQSALTLITTSPLTYGQSETMSASGGSTAGMITYNLVNGSCSIAGALLKATSGTGTCQVTATMAGNSNYNSVTSNPVNVVTLALAVQSITFTTNPPVSAPYNSSFTVAASGGSSGAAVAFTSAGSCSNSGATYKMTTGTGTCSVIANQVGNTNYAAAPQVTKSVNASLATPAVTFTGAPSTAAYNAAFTVTATTNASTTAVIGSGGACSNIGTAVTITSGTGTCSLTATWSADNNYSGTTASQSTTASLIAQAITFTTNPPTTAAYNSSFTVVAAGGASPNPIVFSSGGACSNSGATYKMTSGTGTCSVIANQTGNFNYAAAPQVTKAVSATLASPTVTFTGAPASAAYKAAFAVASTTNASTTAIISSGGACSNVGTAVTMTSGTGACSLTASWAADSKYSSTTATQSTTATPLPQTIAFTINPPVSATYKSSFTVAATGGPSLGAIAFTSTGACSNSGATFTMTASTGTCSVIANQSGNANYAPAVQVTKTVSATGPLLSVSSSAINFGTVYFGSISVQNITLTNVGTAPATINDPILSIVKGGNSSEFVALSLCPKPLAVGKSCTVAIAFVAGPFYTPQTATLQIMSNAPGSPQPVALSASVINPQASLSPTSLGFGTIEHASSSTLNVKLTNPGGTPLSITSISVTGANAASFVQNSSCGSSLAAGANCAVAVKFTPPAVGTFTANLTVVDNAQSGGGKQTVSLSGKGN